MATAITSTELGGPEVFSLADAEAPTPGGSDQEMVRALGPTPVVYGEGLIERVRALTPQGIDAVLDTAGQGVLPDSIALAGSP